MRFQMNDSKFLPVYIGLLKLVGCTFSPDGYVMIGLNANTTMKLRHQDRDVVLPAGMHMNYTRDTDIVFDLIPEPILGAAPSMLRGYCRLLSNRLNVVYATICHSLLMVSIAEINRSQLSKGQLAFIDLMKGADPRTLDAFGRVLRSMTADEPDRIFVKLGFKREAPVNNTPYSRVTRTTFPLYESLRREDNAFGDLKLRKKDRELFIKLLDFILPGSEALDAYDAGSNNTLAPQLDSLMRCAEGMALQFNHTLDAFFSGQQQLKDVYMPISWQSPVG
jgi:hypothetical protein